MLFSGRENAIHLTREYYQEYSCQFNLYYYPFDTQVEIQFILCGFILQNLEPIFLQMCEMVFEVQGKTDKYVKLVKDGEGVEFLGKD